MTSPPGMTGPWSLYGVVSRKIEKVPRNIQGESIEKRLRKFGKTGLNNWSINKSLKGTETGVRKVKLSMRACHTRCKCSMETTRIFVKVKLGIKVLEFVKSLIGGKSL